MPVKAETLYGRVTHVADGDTVTLLLTGEQPPRRVTIRLAQIDAPEVGRGQPGQPFGAQSRNSLRELCFGKLAQGIVESADRYGRTVARLTCEGTPDVNLEQVRRGFAWAFDRYVTDATIVAAHATARAQRVGLWRETAPIAPWEWRKAHSQPLHGGAAVAQK